jgi:hypothetical protein
MIDVVNKKVDDRRLTHDEEELLEAGRKQGMVQGLALAVATFMKYWGEHAGIQEVWGSAGMTIQECYNNGVDEYDIETLIKYQDYLEG